MKKEEELKFNMFCNQLREVMSIKNEKVIIFWSVCTEVATFEAEILIIKLFQPIFFIFHLSARKLF
jgi:hypothetical protein